MLLTEDDVQNCKRLKELIAKQNIPEDRKNLTKQDNVCWCIENIDDVGLVELIHHCCSTTNQFREPLWLYECKLADERQDNLYNELLSKGLETKTCCHPKEKPFVTEVKLDFTPEQWVEIIQEEDGLGGFCYPNVDKIRNILIETLVNNSFITTEDLQICLNAFKQYRDDDVSYVENHMQLVYDSISDHLKLYSFSRAKDPDDIIDAIAMASDSLNGVMYHGTVMRQHMPDVERKFKRDIVIKEKLSFAFPALKTIMKFLENGFDSIEGYVIVKNDKEVVYDSSGMLFYNTKEFAEQNAADLSNIKTKEYGFRRAKVTFPNGLEFLEDTRFPSAEKFINNDCDWS